jgi:hypothetical protein
MSSELVNADLCEKRILAPCPTYQRTIAGVNNVQLIAVIPDLASTRYQRGNYL